MLSIIIPIFNEEGAVEQTIRVLHGILEKAGENFEIVVVNDGSTDRTSSILETIHLPNVNIITSQINRGNGASIKTGIRHSKGDILATVDADGTYPLQDFPKLLA
ncbi:MAG: glycosyltransferase family 2 protein, partial [Candidatus Peribacteraceae bacterium]